MTEGIRDNLVRQERGLELLMRLLQEEFSHLVDRNPQAVGGVEFSIQELLRQLAAEREDLAAMVRVLPGENGRLSKLARTLPLPDGEAVGTALERIAAAEQSCAAQAAANAEIAVGLAGQNRDLIAFIQSEIAPKSESTYSRAGRWRKEDTGPAMVRGRL
jgi:hypothetical protein